MQIRVDGHTHTVSSGHAYSTVTENARAAAAAGMELLLTTDHGPAMEGAPRPIYFLNQFTVGRHLCGVKQVHSVELNILDYDGNIDLTKYYLGYVDMAIASFHPVCLKPGTVAQNTSAYLGAMENPWVRIIGHPANGQMPVDYEALVLGAKRTGVLLELNNSSISPMSWRANSWENATTMLKLCMKHDVPISLGTDSHFHSAVGKFPYCLQLMEEVGFPEELVANTSASKYLQLIG